MRVCTPLNAFCFIYQGSPGFDLAANPGCFQMQCSLAVILQVMTSLVLFLSVLRKVFPFVWIYCVSRNDLHKLRGFFGLHLILLIFRMSRLWKYHFCDWEMQIQLMELYGWNRASHSFWMVAICACAWKLPSWIQSPSTPTLYFCSLHSLWLNQSTLLTTTVTRVKGLSRYHYVETWL